MNNDISKHEKLLSDICKLIVDYKIMEKPQMKESDISFNSIQDAIKPLYKFLEKEFESSEFKEATQCLDEIITKHYTVKSLRDKVVFGLDIDNHIFIVHEDDKEYLIDHLDEIIKASKKYNVSLDDAVVHTDIRFCVAYTSLDGYFNDIGNGRIIDIPKDIFIYLKERDYPEEIYKAILLNDFDINYNFIEAFNKLLNIGKTLKDKKELLGKTDIRILEHIKNKYNPVKAKGIDASIEERFITRFGLDKYKALIKYCKQLNINKDTLMYRMRYKDMTSDEAVDLGEKERKDYGIGYEYNPRGTYFSLREVFYKLCREYMQQK